MKGQGVHLGCRDADGVEVCVQHVYIHLPWRWLVECVCICLSLHQETTACVLSQADAVASEVVFSFNQNPR